MIGRIVFLTCVAAFMVSSRAAEMPNFVFFLVDDLGWADVGCFGSKFHETPHIDALADSGMRFTNGYAACPVCSPTRASIMTGRHPVRVDITDWIPGRRITSDYAKFQHINDRDNLALKEVTLAEALKSHGYQTFFAGKWHLGDRGHWPTDQGFDINIGGNRKGSPPGGYYAPWTNPTLTATHDGEYLTERLTSESIKFLQERSADKPFLLFLSYYNVHAPITPYKKRVEHYREKAAQDFTAPTPERIEHEGRTRMRQDNPAYASMVAAVDDSVGSILSTLEEQGLSDNTVVIFFSDNGGLSTLAPRRNGYAPTCNSPLRAGKGWLYEGGIREPLIVRAPGVTQPASTCDTPVISMDFFPTLLELAGLPALPDKHVDGVSLVPLLRGKKSVGQRELVWHYPHYHGSTWTPGAAIRDGDWKLITLYHYNDVELYNLADDPGERNDLSHELPGKVADLQGKLSAWQRKNNARMPVPIPGQRLKVFLLAGQSNMEGQGVVDLDDERFYNGGRGTLNQVMQDPAKSELYQHIKDTAGNYVTRDDVWVRFQTKHELKAGGLSIGFTGYPDKHHIGPEFQFGHVMGQHYQEPVLLIKTAWGGKSLYEDFRPPSAGGVVGLYYQQMIEEIRTGLANLDNEFPQYRGRGYDIEGFVWFQGWNDMIDEAALAEYPQNLVHLIHDVRTEFKLPQLPFVIGELGNGGPQASEKMLAIRRAQAAAAQRPRDNVSFVSTTEFARLAEDSPNKSHGHHWFGNAESYFLIGDALAKGMLELKHK